MTVVLLDERWPTLIPMEAFAQLSHPVSYTGEIPVKVRWNFGDLVGAEDPAGNGTLVSSDPNDPEVQRRIEAGEKVFVAPSRSDSVYEAQKVMERARSVGEWEMSQTHSSLLPYLAEESQEFIAAVESGASDDVLKDELGDIFLQVLFHAELASRRGAFDFAAVAASFVEKMKRRAPYLFDGTSTRVPIEVQESLWAKGKSHE